MPWAGLQFVIVVFPDHTRLLFAMDDENTPLGLTYINSPNVFSYHPVQAKTIIFQFLNGVKYTLHLDILQ